MRSAELEWLLEASSSDATGFYETIGVTFTRTAGEEAPVQCFANPGGHNHDDKKASCSINVLTGLWHCKGCGTAGNAYQAALAVGRSEEQARDLAKRYGLFLEVEKRETPRLPTEPQLRKWRERLWASPLIVQRLTELKGWSPRAIMRLGLGWDGSRVVFPVRTRVGSKLSRVGVVRYLPGGDPKSKSDPGSRRELFPCPLVAPRGEPLWIVEGEPDAVAMRTLGLVGVGVPGAGSWKAAWNQFFWGRDVNILVDCDEPGRRLGVDVKRGVPHAVVLDLDRSRSDGFDVGDLVAETRGVVGDLACVRGLLEGMAASARGAL